MKILIAKTFGIGNSILSVPMIKAIRREHPEAVIDVLIGTTPDDGGAVEVMRSLRHPLGIIDNIYANQAREGGEYDVAVLAIPYDGRWKNGREFVAKTVIDGRTRPDPATTGLISWEKHEAEYQMENAHFFGYSGQMPSTSFFEEPPIWSKELFDNSIYLGVGYKKDAAGFWKVKHWGNENYAQLLRMLFLRDDKVRVVTTGDLGDLIWAIRPIKERLKSWGFHDRFVHIPTTNLKHAFAVVNSCHMYVGNDTGMMHVAAACERKVIAFFNMENAIIKNPPLCEENVIFEGWKDPVDFEQVLAAIKAFRS